MVEKGCLEEAEFNGWAEYAEGWAGKQKRQRGTERQE